MTTLSGKTAIITGSGRRIGRGIALALANSGVNVVIHYRNSEAEAKDLQRELVTLGVGAWLVRADFNVPGQTEAMLREASNLAGKIDILINNASSFIPSTTDDLKFSDLMRDFQVNAWAPFALSRLFAGRFETGRIVNLIDTRVVGYDRAHIGYILSKKLLLTLTELLAVELAPKITVNAVAPGLILPPPGKDRQFLEEKAATLPLEQHGSISDVTDAVLYLLASGFVTGQVIFVDGGRHLKESYGPNHHQ